MKITKHKKGIVPITVQPLTNAKEKQYSLAKAFAKLILVTVFLFAFSIAQATDIYFTTTTGTTTISGTSTATWPTGNTFTGDIYILANVQVKITGTIYMPRQKTIHIVAGGSLEIDGGTITGTGPHFNDFSQASVYWWFGIDVQGTAANNQPSPASVIAMNHTMSSHGQGGVYMHNGATLEFCIFGIETAPSTMSRAPAPFSYTPQAGGIIICDDAQFTNIIDHSVSFQAYSKMNQSYITNSTFTYDGTYDMTSTPSGNRIFISIMYNTFAPTYPVTTSFSNNTFQVINFSHSGGDGVMGIYAQRSRYSAFHNNFANLYACFYNLDDNSTTNTHVLTYNTGAGCVYGIYESACNVLTARSNSFYFIGDNSSATSQATGIYISGGTQFDVQDNILSSTNAATNHVHDIYGIYTKNTGNFGNIVNYNHLGAGIPWAFSAEGNNHGLLLYCNDLTGASVDYNIFVGTGGLTSGKIGIAPVQGQPGVSAANLFSRLCPVTNADFYQNSGVPNVDYWKYLSVTAENPYCYSPSVFPHNATADRSCGIITYGYNNIGGIESIISGLKSDIAGLPIPPAGTTDQQATYATKNLELQYYIGDMVRANMYFDTTSSTPDTFQIQENVQAAINYVRTETDPVKYYDLINLYIQKGGYDGSYDSASDFVDTLAAWAAFYGVDSEVIKLCSYYNILINGLPGNFDDTWSYTYSSILNTIASSASLAQSKAQSLLQFLHDREQLTDPADSYALVTILYPPTYESSDGGGDEFVAGVKKQLNNAILSIKAYPDPVNDLLQLEISNATGKTSELHLVIYDNLGKVCKDQVIEAGIGNNIMNTVDMHDFAKGMYNLSVTDNENIIHKQVIVKE